MASVAGCSINSVVLFPDRDVRDRPEDFGLRYEPIAATNATDRRIDGWLILPNGPAKGTVLISHGNAGNIGSFLPWAKMLADAGYAAALYDYQGYGRSEGGADVRSLVGDGLAVVRWLRKRGVIGSAGPGEQVGLAGPGDRVVRSLGLLGLSLGTLVSIHLAGNVPEVGGVVLEGALMPAEELKRKFGVLGAAIAWVLAGQIPDELNSGKQIRRVRCPLLFVHSGADEVTSVEGARELFALANEPKQWVEAPGLLHLRPLFDWPAYAATVTAFLDRQLK